MTLQVGYHCTSTAGDDIGGNWNESSTITASTTIANAIDLNTGLATGIAIANTSAFTGATDSANTPNAAGTIPSPGSGSIPGLFYQSYMYASGASTVTLTGVPNGSYSIQIAGNAAGSNTDNTAFTVNGVGPTTYTNNNAGTTAGQTPNAPISLSITVSSGSVTITFPNPGTFSRFNGFILTATGGSNSAVIGWTG